MPVSNQEAYQSLGWIINKSEQGLYIVVADEAVQKEIVEIYRQGAVEIYDYKQQPGEYSFYDLQQWVTSFPATHIFMVVNFHLAVQSEENINRLNFSRDMLEGLGENIIFFVTPDGDDRLATGAYDFYSFLKLRIPFYNYEMTYEQEPQFLLEAEEPEENQEWEAEELKQKLAEANILIEQAKSEKAKAHYCESEKLWLKARNIKKKVLGTEHLEVAEINYELAGVYERQGKYREAENLYKKSLQIRENVLGEEHPDTAAAYADLGTVYYDQGKYREAEELYKRALVIFGNVLGEANPNAAAVYYNLARMYADQGKYEPALVYYYKAYKIFLSVFGINHPKTQIAYSNMKLTFEEWKPEERFEQWLEEKSVLSKR